MDLGLEDGETLTVMLNHLKSQFVDVRGIKDKAEREREARRQTERNDRLRAAQAARVAEIVADRRGELVCVVGDLNHLPGHASIAPIYEDAGLLDPFTRLPEQERWTHWYRGENTVGQLEHLLLSPALAERCPDAPRVERRGISFTGQLNDGGVGPRQTRLEAADGTLTKIDFRFERFDDVGPKTYASDHCPATVTID